MKGLSIVADIVNESGFIFNNVDDIYMISIKVN